MVAVLPGVLALAVTPLAMAWSRHWPRLMCLEALAVCPLPFLLPTSEPFLRAAAALLTWLLLAKALQYAAGHERPPPCS